jgi:hypothetical protein
VLVKHYATLCLGFTDEVATITFNRPHRLNAGGGGPTKGGVMRISVDGVQKASGRMEHVVYMPQNSEEFNIGHDSGGLVSPDYKDENTFRGTINRVEVLLR